MTTASQKHAKRPATPASPVRQSLQRSPVMEAAMDVHIGALCEGICSHGLCIEVR